MKFLRIGTTKLKVMLTREERERFSIDSDFPECDRGKIKQTLSEILRTAKLKGEFDIGHDKVLVQLYPEANGGCEVFITKLTYLTEREQRDVLSAENVTSLERVETVFKFSSFDDLVRACRAIKDDSIESDLYYNGESYYIKALENSIDGLSALFPLYEFGERTKDVPIDALYERGRLLMRGDSIKKLSRL